MKHPAFRFAWFWFPLAAYAGIIVLLSSMPAPPIPTINIPNFDKVLHIIEYSGFGLLLCRALAAGGEGLSSGAALIWTVILGAIFGASDEVHQYFVPNRSADVFDFMVDVIGSFIGGAAYWLLALRNLKGPSEHGASDIQR